MKIAIQGLTNYRNLGQSWYQPCCNSFCCGVSLPPFKTKEEAIKQWNSRKLCVYDKRAKSIDMCDGYFLDDAKTRLTKMCKNCEAYRGKTDVFVDEETEDNI